MIISGMSVLILLPNHTILKAEHSATERIYNSPWTLIEGRRRWTQEQLIVKAWLGYAGSVTLCNVKVIVSSVLFCFQPKGFLQMLLTFSMDTSVQTTIWLLRTMLLTKQARHAKLDLYPIAIDKCTSSHSRPRFYRFSDIKYLLKSHSDLKTFGSFQRLSGNNH